MNTHREQKNGRVVQMPVYISNHITNEMIELFLKSGEALTVNAGIMSEQVVLPYLEKHFGSKGIVANADGYDHLFENGIRNEHKKLAIRKTSAAAKNIGKNKEGKCDTISFHHAVANAIYIIKSDTFFNNAILNYDKTGNCYDVNFYSDMKLKGKGKRIGCNAWKNTEMLLKHADKVAL
tara:strand:- start:4693 stop:5229 length:537 start_codon:yes stop_codon:yes gene_type:complete